MKLKRKLNRTRKSLLPLAIATVALPGLGQNTPALSDHDAAEPQTAREGERGVEEGSFEAKNDPLQPIKGARTPAPAAEAEKAEREWFGQGNAWWNWKRFTGDWGGARTAWEEKGLAFGLAYTFDGASVLKGGLHRRSVAGGLLDLNLTLDTDAAFGLKGGTLFAQYYFRHGRFGNDDVGSAQGYSNIDEARLSRAEEVWYEQKLLNDRLRVKVGQVDANSEFDFAEAAGDFINPTAGFSPTIAGFRTYPDPGVSVNVFIYPTEQIYLGGGYYADNFKQLSGDSFKHPFLIGELGFTHGGHGRFAAGRLAVGGWRDTASVDRIDGGEESGTAGFYLVAEQMIWKENLEDKDDAQGISVFGQYGWADDEVSPFAQHFSMGVSAAGLLDGRDDDATGLRLSWVGLSRASASGFDANETNLEFFYRAQITPCISVKPGLQWFHHPGGIKDADDTVVGTLRASIDF